LREETSAGPLSIQEKTKIIKSAIPSRRKKPAIPYLWSKKDETMSAAKISFNCRKCEFPIKRGEADLHKECPKCHIDEPYIPLRPKSTEPLEVTAKELKSNGSPAKSSSPTPKSSSPTPKKVVRKDPTAGQKKIIFKCIKCEFTLKRIESELTKECPKCHVADPYTKR